jgi:hypothetical protein
MPLLFCLLYLLTIPSPPPAEAATLARGHDYFRADFEGADALRGWAGLGVLAPGRGGGHALLVERSAGSAKGSTTVQRRLPVEQMRGYMVYFSAQIKAENISAKPKPWNGIKFAAPIVAASGKQFPEAKIDAGTFDWRRATFAVRVPDDAQSMSLALGLESVTGKVWFDDVRLWVGKPPLKKPSQVADRPVYKGHDLPRLRGAMVSPRIDADGLKTFAKGWNGNVIRWQVKCFNRKPADPPQFRAYDAWLHSALDQLDAALPVCEQSGLRVVVCLFNPPITRQLAGGFAAADAGLFADAACQAKFVDVWRQIARRFRHAKAIWGYDLVNEPIEGVIDDGLADWQTLAERAARAIREIDPQRTIIVEPTCGGGPDGFRELRPINVPNVVYSFHMYKPHTFTHQGVNHGRYRMVPPVHYPGIVDGKFWDKAQLEATMQPAVDFQKTYNVHLYVGEFSAIRWAPDDSAYRYLKDLIELFEAHGWDWSYHAFREWDGWSTEHGPDPANHARLAVPTTRHKLLREWFSQNQKPDRR